MSRHYPILEINCEAARAVWPRHAYKYVGASWKLAETLVDFDRIKHVKSADEARAMYAATADRLNAEYGKGHTLFRASSAYQ